MFEFSRTSVAASVCSKGAGEQYASEVLCASFSRSAAEGIEGCPALNVHG